MPSPGSGVVVPSPGSGVVVPSPGSGVVVPSPGSGVVVPSPGSGVVVPSPGSGVVVPSPGSGVVVPSPSIIALSAFTASVSCSKVRTFGASKSARISWSFVSKPICSSVTSGATCLIRTGVASTKSNAGPSPPSATMVGFCKVAGSLSAVRT